MTTTIDGLLGVNNVAPNSIDVGDLNFTLPYSKYYETTINGWIAGQNITVNHNLGVVPKSIEFEAVAITPVFNLAVGDTEDSITFTNTATYGCVSRKKTTTNLIAAVGSAGLCIYNTSNLSAAVTNTQVNLKIKVFA